MFFIPVYHSFFIDNIKKVSISSKKITFSTFIFLYIDEYIFPQRTAIPDWNGNNEETKSRSIFV